MCIRDRGGVLVVAVATATTAAMRDMQVDLAKPGGRLAAQRSVTVEAGEHGEVGGLVDVHPERKLQRLETARPGGAQRVGQERRRAHRRRGEEVGDRVPVGPPGCLLYTSDAA